MFSKKVFCNTYSNRIQMLLHLISQCSPHNPYQDWVKSCLPFLQHVIRVNSPFHREGKHSACMLWTSVFKPQCAGRNVSGAWLEQYWLRPHSSTYSCTESASSVPPFFQWCFHTPEWCTDGCSLHWNPWGNLCLRLEQHCKLYLDSC